MRRFQEGSGGSASSNRSARTSAREGSLEDALAASWERASKGGHAQRFSARLILETLEQFGPHSNGEIDPALLEQLQDRIAIETVPSDELIKLDQLMSEIAGQLPGGAYPGTDQHWEMVRQAIDAAALGQRPGEVDQMLSELEDHGQEMLAAHQARAAQFTEAAYRVNPEAFWKRQLDESTLNAIRSELIERTFLRDRRWGDLVESTQIGVTVADAVKAGADAGITRDRLGQLLISQLERL